MGVAAFPTDTDARESLKAHVERIFSQLKLNVYFPSWVHRISYNQTGWLSSVGQHRVCVHVRLYVSMYSQHWAFCVGVCSLASSGYIGMRARMHECMYLCMHVCMYVM